jgi:DNA-binding response OmpR family regulator
MGTEGGSLKAGNGQESPVHTQHQILDGFGQRLVVAHHDTNYARKAGRHFRGLGWKVHCADTAGAARCLARACRPAAVILDTDLPDESGWLTCDKLTREQPALRVILVSGQPNAERSRFADFVGASALVSRKASVRALAREVLGDLLPAAS